MDTTTTSLLTVEGLEVRYGAIVGVTDMSLTIREGELVALVGANGSGKSTTLGAIAGVHPPVRGTVHFDGAAIHGLKSEVIARRGISLVPEDRGAFPSLTVEQNLRLGAALRTDQSMVASEIQQVLDRFPILRDRSQQAAGTLSGGEQQQLVIARALLTRPRLLMLDEPSLGLSPRLVDQMYDLIQELHQEGVTILLVEQNVTRALEIAERAYLLSTGNLIAHGTPDELRTTSDITSAYMGVAVAHPQTTEEGEPR